MRGYSIQCVLVSSLIVACTPAGGNGNATPTGPAASASANKAAPHHVIVVSVDGLMPASYLDPDSHGLRVPTMREMRSSGAYATGARSVFPTVTYPSHTTMATGVPPRKHGVVSNTTFDPMLKNDDGWYWYTEDIKVPTIWQVVKDAGYETALVDWPVTLGARVDHLVPEYWRAGTADDKKLARAISSPGLLDEVAQQFPGFWERYAPPHVQDQAGIDIAVHLIEKHAPALLMVHIWALDSAEHDHGPWSDQAKQATEVADAQIARLIEAAKKKGIWDKTTIFLVSDHGFLPIQKRIRLGALLLDRGLITLSDDGKTVTDWRASVEVAGATAYLYLKDPNDLEAARMLEEIIDQYQNDPNGGHIARRYTPQEIAELGGDERAFMALEAEPGWAFKGGYLGGIDYKTSSKGHHGFDPGRPELQASFIAYGPTVAPAQLGQVNLMDVAPTVAHWLGLAMPLPVDGQVLDIPRR